MLAHQASATNLLFITLHKSEVLLFVREQRKQDGRPGATTDPFVCLGFANYESHEGERILFVHEWRFAGGWSGRSRRRGCQAVAWHKSGVGGLREGAGQQAKRDGA